MRRRVVHFLATVLTLLVLSHLGFGIASHGIWPAVWAAVVLGVVNLLVRPLLRLLTLPLTCLTLGLFGWIVSALMLWLTSALVPGFVVAGFIPALEGAVILGVVTGVVTWAIK